MTFIKLVEEAKVVGEAKVVIDYLYDIEKSILSSIDTIEMSGRNRWLSIGRTNIEQGFMALRKGITEKHKDTLEIVKNHTSIEKSDQ